MLDSAGRRVAEQGQLQFLAERRGWLDIPDGCRVIISYYSFNKLWQNEK